MDVLVECVRSGVLLRDTYFVFWFLVAVFFVCLLFLKTGFLGLGLDDLARLGGGD